MEFHDVDGLTIALEKQGHRSFTKGSYPIRYGRYHEITTPEHVYQLNLNGEVKHVRGRGEGWPHPAEWLKRTAANDWVYYSALGYAGAHSLMGEHYIPCPAYPTNSLLGGDPFSDAAVRRAIGSVGPLLERIARLDSPALPGELRDLLARAVRNDEKLLAQKAEKLHAVIGATVPVLPPDTRDADYDVIPLIVADGCLCECGFCRVKAGPGFAPRSRENILAQLEGLKELFGRDLPNHGALFLGANDALAAQDLLEFAATSAYRILGFERSHIDGLQLHLFGSVRSLLGAGEGLFGALNVLPFSTRINIGLESADPATLGELGKPVSADLVGEAFARMLHVNRTFEKVEISANLVLGRGLPSTHLPACAQLVRGHLDRSYGKGAIYLSPLVGRGGGAIQGRRDLLDELRDFQISSRLPAYLYLIQRL